MITIVDYKMINLGSIQNMLKKIGAEFIVTSDKDQLREAQKVILPGVGAFDQAMTFLKNHDLIDSLKFLALEKRVPFLGICLGMQLMTKGSEEGSLDGLGLIDAQAKRFQAEGNLKVPHMGWNQVLVQKQNDIFPNEEFRKFYFVHSFYVSCADKRDILTETEYGKNFVSSFQKDNLIGVQFHPEKSHRYGIELFSNFVRLP